MQMMLGGLLLYLGSRHLNDKEAKWWALGFVVNGLSLFVFALNTPESWELPRNMLNHLALGASSVFFLIGFWKFGQQPIRIWLLVLLMAFPLTSIIAWEVLWPNARFRVLCTATGYVVFLLALQQALTSPVRSEYARTYQRLRWVVIIYLLVYVWSYVSIAEILPTSARQSLDYHRAIFSLSSLLFMLTLAVGCLALKFASLAARNSDLAMRDWLTDLLNRRGYFAAVESQPTSHRGSHNSSYLLAIDIDHFKNINDAEGHAAGDQVLQQFAQLLKTFEGSDRIVSRMGGEEFLVTLFNSTEADALQLAEDIRQQAEKNEVRLPQQKTIRYTISIGVHQVSQPEKIEQALAQADEALYTAKRNGRNQVVLQ